MNKGRASHASCSVGSMIYLFSGVEKDGITPPKKTTVERLFYERNGTLNGTWELLKFSQKQFPMRKHLGVVPISPNRIIILGGMDLYDEMYIEPHD